MGASILSKFHFKHREKRKTEKKKKMKLTLSEGDFDDDLVDVRLVVFAERDGNDFRPHPEGQGDGSALVGDGDTFAVSNVDDSPRDLKEEAKESRM